MLTVIWSILICLSIVYSSLTGRGGEIINMLNSSIQSAASLFLSIAPLMCFWSGVMEITARCGASEIICRLLSPLTKVLFPSIKDDKEALSKISMNMSANILGMGNAATPLGLLAMERLDKINPSPYVASNAMCMFVVVNTASIQLIPSTVITLRAQFGSLSPSDTIPATLITTVAAFTVGCTAAKLCAKKLPRRKKMEGIL